MKEKIFLTQYRPVESKFDKLIRNPNPRTKTIEERAHFNFFSFFACWIHLLRQFTDSEMIDWLLGLEKCDLLAENVLFVSVSQR